MIRHRAAWLASVLVVLATIAGCGAGSGSTGAPVASGLPSRTPQASASAPAVAPSRVAPPSVAVSTPQRAAPSAAATVAATSGTDSDTSTSGWVIAGIVLVLALAVGIPLVGRQRRLQRWHDWQARAKGAVATGRLTEQLMPVSPAQIDDVVQWQNVGHQVEQAARTLDEVADSSPKPVGNTAAHQAAQGLRDLSFALESGRAAQGDAASMADLVAVEVAAHDRRDELDVAFAELDDLVAEPIK